MHICIYLCHETTKIMREVNYKRVVNATPKYSQVLSYLNKLTVKMLSFTWINANRHCI